MPPPVQRTSPSDQTIASYSVQVTSAVHADQSMQDIWSSAGLSVSGTKLGWYYHGNPLLQPKVLLLTHEQTGQAIGTCSLGYRQMQFNGMPVMAANRCDLAVMTAHRGGQATPLLLDQVRTQGLTNAKLVYGFPNRRAQRSVASAGFHKMGLLQTYTKVLNIKDWARSKLPPSWHPITKGWLGTINTAWQLSDWMRTEQVRGVTYKLTRPDDSFDELWHTQSELQVLMGVRDQSYLKWRFAPAIYPEVQFLVAYDQSDSALGYAAFVIDDGRCNVLDFLARPEPESWALKALMSGLFKTAMQAGSFAVNVDFFGSSTVTDTFVALGMSLRAGRPIYGAGTLAQAFTHDAFYFTWADADV